MKKPSMCYNIIERKQPVLINTQSQKVDPAILRECNKQVVKKSLDFEIPA